VADVRAYPHRAASGRLLSGRAQDLPVSFPAPASLHNVRASRDRDGLDIVTSEWIAGIFGALGAALGASAALASSLIGTRAQRDLADASQKAQTAEVRRTAYAQHLTAVYSFMERARELVARIENDAAGQECEMAHRAYLDDWERLQPTYAPVIVAGPDEIVKSAEALRFALGLLGDGCDAWYAAHMNSTEFDGEEVLDAQQAARKSRSAFADEARKHSFG
jgi:hypothetical protein